MTKLHQAQLAGTLGNQLHVHTKGVRSLTFLYGWSDWTNSRCSGMLKRGNFHILCLFYVLARLMNGLGVKTTDISSTVQYRPVV